MRGKSEAMSSASMASHDSTRDRLIDAISVDGPIAAGELAERFGLTGAAVRRHLTQLEAEGVIQERERSTRARGRGRPRKEFVLASHASVPDLSESEELALLAMDALGQAGGSDALLSLARRRTAAWEKEFFSRYDAERAKTGNVSPERRAEIVVDLLQELGYAASLRPVSVKMHAPSGESEEQVRTITTVQLCQGRCPVQEIATAHGELCEVETESLERMLGMPVRRLSTRASGAHACTTHLTPPSGHHSVEPESITPAAMETPTDLSSEGRKP